MSLGEREEKAGWWYCKPRLRDRWLHQRTPLAVTARVCGRRGRSVYVGVHLCVFVRYVEVSDGGGAEPEQLIKH